MADKLQAYCVKCKTKRDILDAQAVYTKTGTPGTRGSCAECGTTLFRMGETEAHANVPKPEVIEQPKRKKKKSQASSKKKNAKRKRNGKLVIVESPAKARSVGGFLGKDYTVMASKGHVRDLLVTQLSVDVDNGFEPKYRVPNDKRETVKALQEAAETASEIYLATDPDREGEAIAWHLIAAANMDEDRVQRVVFHEITRSAIEQAFEHPREIDMNLVNAQQARRILDRLVGYNITQLLWDRVRNRLSAGRVQSIAVRLVVDREREIEAFIPEEYWTLDAELQKQPENGNHTRSFIARLAKINGEDVSFGSEGDVKPHLDILEKSQYVVQDVKHGTRQRRPSAPFTTSTLQQEASRKFGFAAQRTMRIAQQLYEGITIEDGSTVGLITYMRTDSTNVSEQAQQEARHYINERFGQDYVPDKPPKYKTKAKTAQEAHEAIRPTSVLRQPDAIKSLLTRDQFKLYKLIWERFVASQMANAVYKTIRVAIEAGISEGNRPYLFRVSGSTLQFPGFLAIYEETRDEDLASDDDEGRILPDLRTGEFLDLRRLLPEQHFTQPPPRYTEASLVRTLEEYGIGRPSTYAPTLAVIQDRDYVTKEDKRLIPTDTGKLVNDLLVKFFPDILDYQFTANMEDQLDEIAIGKLEWRPMLEQFYGPFEKQLQHAREHMPQSRQVEYIGRDCPQCGESDGGQLIIRYGKWGKFIGCSRYPDCKYTEPYLELTGVACPQCGQEHAGELVQRRTRKGRTFYGCSRYPDCDYSAWKLPPESERIMIEDIRDEKAAEQERPAG